MSIIEQCEILRRRDMRDVFTFTIDPADAKDFDDALSFALNGDGTYQIGVHIADVSFYVRPNTKIDDDAYKRGTSVYLVDRVLPMLPEELCNDKCSLRPNEDKLCMSVIFTMDADARVLKYKICRTVICSNARLNYDEAQAIIEANQTNDTESSENRIGGKSESEPTLNEIIPTLNALAAKLRTERIANGALTIEQDEMRFRLDEHGHPTEIYFEQSNEAHHLIEEFMLLANRTVAKAVGSGRPFVYRVHDLPNADKLDDLQAFKRKMGKRVSQQALDMLTIRAQAKAVYSTYNIGHYGLAFSHYTHFTSPIRRYPDLMVHRLVEKYILTGKKETLTREELEEKCEHCSACEQEAAQAERDSIKLFQAMWINDHIGEVLPGHISGVTDFGLFVQLDESRCEGLIHISKIGEEGEYWQYDEKNYRLVCENKKSYTLGDPVMVKVVRADINRAQIDFEFA
ncbi:MAG: RNB domain-containing ribonuclease [Paludibacteraceae bacterium]|nr:RNB domain-containing ribonuclease [Paludibacteraceae bacterium]